jgi:hypothetical protein
MIPDEARDPILIGLGRLTALAPDPARAERVRTRCRAAVTRCQQRVVRASHGRKVARHVLTSAVVAGFSLIYLSALVYDVLQLHDVR